MIRVKTKYRRSVVAVMVAVVVLMVAGTILVSPVASSAAQVIPLASNAFGNTRGEWSSRWWQWVLSKVWGQIFC